MAGAVETEVDNSTLELGGNNFQNMILEVIAGVDRVIPAGTAVTQKAADGTKMVLHTAQLTTQIDGHVHNDIVVAADAGVTVHNSERTISGLIDSVKYAAINSLTTIDDIPAGAAYSYRMQLETKGFRPMDRQPL